MIVSDRRPEMTLCPPDWPWLAKGEAVERRHVADRRQRRRGARPGRLRRCGVRPDDVLLVAAGDERGGAITIDHCPPERATGADGRRRPGDRVPRDPPPLGPAGSFVFVLSDFLVETPSPPGSARSTAGWDVVPVVIQDPVWEQSFPQLDGIVAPVAATGGRTRLVRMRRGESARWRQEPRAAAASACSRGFASLGIEPVLVASTDHGAAVRRRSSTGRPSVEPPGAGSACMRRALLIVVVVAAVVLVGVAVGPDLDLLATDRHRRGQAGADRSWSTARVEPRRSRLRRADRRHRRRRRRPPHGRPRRPFGSTRTSGSTSRSVRGRSNERHAAGGSTFTYRYRLQCLGKAASRSAPAGGRPSRSVASATSIADATRRTFTEIDWPAYQRDGSRRRRGRRANRLARVRPRVVPEPTYRVDPVDVAVGLLLLAAAIAVAGGWLGWRLLRVEREIDVDEAIVARRSPLELALEAANTASESGDAVTAKVALERVARELTGAGEPSIAAQARSLAWSPNGSLSARHGRTEASRRRCRRPDRSGHEHDLAETTARCRRRPRTSSAVSIAARGGCGCCSRRLRS